VTTFAVEAGAWTFLASAVVALGALGGIIVNSRGSRDATRLAGAAQTVETKAKEFTILQQTLDAVVEDQRRQREEAERVRTALAACLTDRKIARTNEGLLLDWIRERFPGEPIPKLIDQKVNGGLDESGF